MTIPEVRHCLVALASRIEAGEAGDPQETAAILRYLAEQTRRAPRGSKAAKSQPAVGPTGRPNPPRTGELLPVMPPRGREQDEAPEQQAAAE